MHNYNYLILGQTFNIIIIIIIIIIFIAFIAHFNIKRYDHDLCVKPLLTL